MNSRHNPRSVERAPARPRWIPAVVVVAVVAAAIAGCGGSSATNSVAAVGASTSAAASAAPVSGSPAPTVQDSAKLVKYAQCMRSHGVPGFPDPVGGRLTLRVTPATAGALNPDSPAFKAAAQDCKSLAPAGLGQGATASPQVQAQALKFSRCMRSHGVPGFPDPSFSGGGVRIRVHGIDPNSPAFQKAQQTCSSLVPGGAP